jgi:hypothetical protein
MSTYKIKFKLNSFYHDNEYNLEKFVSLKIDADDLEELEEIIDDSDYMSHIDDSSVINKTTENYPKYINIDYIELKDEEGNILYEEKNEYSTYLVSDTVH